MPRAWGVFAGVVVLCAGISWGIRTAVRPAAVRGHLEEALPPEKRQRLEQLQQWVARDSNNFAAVLELANLYYDLGRFAEAVPLYRRYVAADPAAAEVRIDYASALFASGQEEAGIAELQRVLERFPDHPIALFNLGVFWAQQGKWEQARQMFERLIRLHPQLSLSERARQALRTIDSLQSRTAR
jgi:tetratricopeptide (TPR) repeat protein